MGMLMKTKGIRISESKGDVLSPTLLDILEEITDGDSYYWCILFLYGIPKENQGSFLSQYEEIIKNSDNGISISWIDLKKLSDKFFQMYEITVLGARNLNLLKRYESEDEMYDACDIVIDLIDRAFWEVYSKDVSLINRLAKKFNDIEFLEVVAGSVKVVKTDKKINDDSKIF
jgi:hypothetical protein